MLFKKKTFASLTFRTEQMVKKSAQNMQSKYSKYKVYMTEHNTYYTRNILRLRRNLRMRTYYP